MKTHKQHNPMYGKQLSNVTKATTNGVTALLTFCSKDQRLSLLPTKVYHRLYITLALSSLDFY